MQKNIPFKFNFAIPLITSFSPKEITSEQDIITVTGENFIPGYMYYQACGSSSSIVILEETPSFIKFQFSDTSNVACSKFNLKIRVNDYITETAEPIKINAIKAFSQLSSFPGGGQE
jgi:hypothetical protein